MDLYIRACFWLTSNVLMSFTHLSSFLYLSFKRAVARTALDECGGDYSKALEKLLEARERDEADAEPELEP